MYYNGFTIFSLRDSKMEGEPTKILGRGTLTQSKIAVKLRTKLNKNISECSLGIGDCRILRKQHRILWLMFDSLRVFFIQTWRLFQIILL